MKPLLLLITYFGLSFAKVPSQYAGVVSNITQLAQQCKQQTNATEDVQQLIDTMTVPTSPEGKCMVACVMKDLGMMKNGKVDSKGVDAFGAKVVPQGFMPLVDMYLEDCHASGTSSSDACVNAASYVTCARHLLEVNFPMFLPSGSKAG